MSVAGSRCALRRLALGASLVSACSSATGTGYPGQPLFTISGQMVADRASLPGHPIRLAIAWYLDPRSPSGPVAIVPQDVQYTGTFPQQYAFAFYGPPPPVAIVPTTIEGMDAGAAFGWLVAYEDLNGNGQLDIIPEDGGPIDHILATSIGNVWNGEPAANPVHVAYFDGPPPSSLKGFVAGYNLYGSDSRALSPQTPVELDLNLSPGPNELDFFACPTLLGETFPNENTVLPCHIPPTGGVRVSGTLVLGNGVPSAGLQVTDGLNPLPWAQVAVNGAPLTWSPTDGLFEGEGSGLANPDAGVDLITVAGVGDAGVWSLSLPKIGDFVLQSPSPSLSQHFLQGTSIDVTWSSSAPGATQYQLTLLSTLLDGGADLSDRVPAVSGSVQSAQLTAPAVDGPESLYVFGGLDQLNIGRGGSVLIAGTYRSASIDLAPANTGLTASGELFVIDYIGEDFAPRSALSFVQPFEGATPLATPQVTVDGQPVRWDPLLNGYYDDVDIGLNDGELNPVVVDAGTSILKVPVAIPGDFTLSALNGQPVRADAGTALLISGSLAQVSWTPSAGASAYTVLLRLEDVDGGAGEVLFATSTSDAGITVVVPTLVGAAGAPSPLPSQPTPAWLSVDALSAGSDRHLVGVVENLLPVKISH